MSRMASWVSKVMTAGSTTNMVPSGVSTVLTPSVVTSRYSVSSWPMGSSSVNSNSGVAAMPSGYAPPPSPPSSPPPFRARLGAVSALVSAGDHQGWWSPADRKRLTEGAHDVSRVVDDIGGGELEHEEASLLELVAPMRVLSAVAVGGVTVATAHLHDDC